MYMRIRKKVRVAVKIMSVHDFNDFEVWKCHKFLIIDIMNADGELFNNVPDIFQRLDHFEAIGLIVALPYFSLSL